MTTLTDHYIAVATSSLKRARRGDAEEALRAAIRGRIEARVAAGETVEAAEYATLQRLGDPKAAALGYRAQRHGPIRETSAAGEDWTPDQLIGSVAKGRNLRYSQGTKWLVVTVSIAIVAVAIAVLKMAL